MNNIPQNKLQELADQTAELVAAINKSVDWTDSYESDNANLALNLKYYRRKLKKIQNVITGKPVIAFFGASQVGKSYMVNSLLCDESKKLYIADHRNPDIKVDFIRDINPEGHGNESTSVVTRFSTDKADPEKPPVKIKLLSAKDLVCILCDSYFSDVKDKTLLDYEQRTQLIFKQVNHLESLTSKHSHSFFHEDDVYEIQEYLENNFQHSSKDTLDSFSKIGYWGAVARHISTIAPQKWVEVFGILWNNHSYINNLFQNLLNELEKINFSKTVYTDFSSVRRGEGAILDVKTLDGLFQQSANFEVRVTTENSSFPIKNSYLCALCAEVVLSIAGEYPSEIKREITKNIDVLDFPGARTRLELQEGSIGDINVKEMVLRGKVSYLFNSYSANYEINNLFVCMRTSQTNVRGVPSLLKGWLDYNIGETPEERYKTIESAAIPPLFIIFTWWNTLLGFSSSTDTANPKERVEKWLKTRFKEEIIGDYDWNSNWIRNNGMTSPFHNYFLLRDFIKSYEMNKIFDRKYLNADRSEYEEIVSSDQGQNDFLQDFKQVFVASDLVRTFFKDPLLNWEESSIPNKDGTELILKNILLIANNQTRTKRYLYQLNEWTKKVHDLVRQQHHSDNADEEIMKAAREVAEIHGYMNKIFGIDAYNFGDFLNNLTISEEEIKILYRHKLLDPEMVQETSPAEWIHFIEYSPRLSPENTYEQNLKILQEDYYLGANLGNKEIEAYFKDKYDIDVPKMLSLWNTQQDKSAALAAAATKLWIDTRLNVNRFNGFVGLGFEKAALGNLLENIQRSFERLKLKEAISEKIGYYVDRLKRLDIAEDMIAHITAGIINNFVMTLGWEYFSKEEKETLETVNTQNNLRINLPAQNGIFHALDNDSIDDLFQFMSNLNENLRKIPLDETVIHKVPMISNYKRWREMVKISFIANCNMPTYDVEANRQLGDILQMIAACKFTLS